MEPPTTLMVAPSATMDGRRGDYELVIPDVVPNVSSSFLQNQAEVIMPFPAINVPGNLQLNVPVGFTPRVDLTLLRDTQTKLSLARYPEEQLDY